MTTLYDLNVAATPAITIGQAISGAGSVDAGQAPYSRSTVFYTVPDGQFAIITIYSAQANAWANGGTASANVKIGEFSVLSATSSANVAQNLSGSYGPVYVGPGQSISIQCARDGYNTSASASIRFSGMTFVQT